MNNEERMKQSENQNTFYAIFLCVNGKTFLALNAMIILALASSLDLHGAAVADLTFKC